MAVNPDTTIRKMLSLPKPLAEQIDRFRERSGFKSEADAYRRLLELGLTYSDTAETLLDRCKGGTESGLSLGQVYGQFLEHHPLVRSATFDTDDDGHPIAKVWLQDEVLMKYSRSDGWTLKLPASLTGEAKSPA